MYRRIPLREDTSVQNASMFHKAFGFDKCCFGVWNGEWGGMEKKGDGGFSFNKYCLRVSDGE